MVEGAIVIGLDGMVQGATALDGMIQGATVHFLTRRAVRDQTWAGCGDVWTQLSHCNHFEDNFCIPDMTRILFHMVDDTSCKTVDFMDSTLPKFLLVIVQMLADFGC